MRFARIDDWLSWQEGLHPCSIELGLERVREVADRLGHRGSPGPVISVAGTNGKGSCVAMLDSILRAGGYRTATYTSPHLLRYNERIRIDGKEVDDDELCRAFAQVDQARGDISLTYFEFGTLAALDVFARSRPDILILEVGLGGRLDAVNILDPDIALISSIGLDHTDWLGADLESIAREKAGILRPNRPGVLGMAKVPVSLLREATRLGARIFRSGVEFSHQQLDNGWNWRGPERGRYGLPLPALRGRFQLDNAAAVLMVIELLQESLPLSQQAIREGLEGVRLPGRFQLIPGDVSLILDVAHNPQAIQSLAETLRLHQTQGKTHAVYAALKDKDILGALPFLADQIASWHLPQLQGDRALSLDELGSMVTEATGSKAVRTYASVAEAFAGAHREAGKDDRILVFGSFLTVAGVMSLIV